MAEVQMLFPMEPKEFWQKLKLIVEQVVIEHKDNTSLSQTKDRPLLKPNEVCNIFKISKPTLYEWMSQGKLPSVKIKSRRFFRREDIDQLIEDNRVGVAVTKSVDAMPSMLNKSSTRNA
jgi:excisionase family DNA binding protein